MLSPFPKQRQNPCAWFLFFNRCFKLLALNSLRSFLLQLCCLWSLLPKRSSLLTTVSAGNVAHLSDSQYGKTMNFYAEIRTCSCHSISPTLESHAIYSVCFIFLILHSKKIFGLTGNSQCYSCLYMEAEIWKELSSLL